VNTTKGNGRSDATLGNGNKARIFIVEGQPMFRFGLASLLNEQPDLIVVGEAYNTVEATAGIKATNPNLVTVELTLKAGNGLELIKALRAQNSSLGILVISLHDEILNAELALHAGASGYLMKDATLEDTLLAVRRVLAGKIYLSEKMTYSLLSQRSQRPLSLEPSPVGRLSNREKEVLLLIGQWRRTKDIAKDIHLSIKTVEYYRSRIRTKLNLNSGNDLVRFATNYILEHQTSGTLPTPEELLGKTNGRPTTA
jgi:DNA-binding NarL/FixJ family response regulator